MLPADSPTCQAETSNPVIRHDSNEGTSRLLCRSRFQVSATIRFFAGRTVLLIDDNDKIVGINRELVNLKPLAAKAQLLGEAVEEADAEHYAN